MSAIEKLTGIPCDRIPSIIKEFEQSGATSVNSWQEQNGTCTILATFAAAATRSPGLSDGGTVPFALAPLAATPVLGKPESSTAIVGADDQDRLRSAFRAFCDTFKGKLYRWGGSGPFTYDCSGLIQVLLARLQLDPAGDQTSHELYRHFREPGNGAVVSGPADLGCLAFFGDRNRIGHVGLCIDSRDMIEAAGGGPEITTNEAAIAADARVKIQPITRRRDLVALLRPMGLPWSYRGATGTASRTTPRAWRPEFMLPPIQAGIDLPAISEQEMTALHGWQAFVQEAGDQFGIDLHILCGIGSRESRWGLALKPPGPAGTGDATKRGARDREPVRPAGLPPDGAGFGRGLMQIDWDAHLFAREGRWQDAHENILYGARVLRGCMQHMRTSLGGLSDADLVRCGIAGYNRGPGNVVKTVRRLGMAAVDEGTAHNNYAQDVIARAHAFKASGLFGG